MPQRIHPPPISPSITPFPPQPSSSHDQSKINPALLLVIVILAIIFFLCGFLHLLVRFLVKPPSTPRRRPESSESVALQRQLQQLFRLHDSGLDQAIVDSLPVFCYKEIVGLNDPFDCAVCLCEFSDQDHLRLLPVCSHAFHVSCIDTWLLSNSTCPLCRRTLENHPLSSEPPLRPTIMEEAAGERRVYSVRLGKFRSVNNEETEEDSNGGSRNGDLDARRCFSMGACEYVIDESDLLVEMCDGLEVEGKKISGSSKGESFSVSKIWQWSKKGRLQSSCESNVISV